MNEKKRSEDEQFARKLEDNIEEIKEVDAAGVKIQEDLAKQAPISEEEARNLLKEEKRLAEIEYKGIQKKNKKTLIVVLVVAVILCALGGVFAVVMANRGDKKQDNQDTGVNTPIDEEKPIEKPSEAPKDNEEAVKTVVAKVKAAVEDYLNRDEEWLIFEDDNSIRPLYQSSTMKAATTLNRSFGFGADSARQYSDEEYRELLTEISGDEFKEVVKKVFTDNGFTEIGQEWTPTPEMINYETGVICTGVGTGLPIYFGCGHISWLDPERVALVDALADAYYAKEGRFVGSLNAEVANIKDSEVKPYQTINVNLFGAMGLFYRTSPEAEWKFFMGTQALLSCDDYDTEELRNAYAGETCYDTATNEDSVVKL